MIRLLRSRKKSSASFPKHPADSDELGQTCAIGRDRSKVIASLRQLGPCAGNGNVSWGKRVVTRSIPHQASPLSPRNDGYTIRASAISSTEALGLQSTGDVGRSQGTFHYVIQTSMSGQSSPTLATAQSMDSRLVYPGSTEGTIVWMAKG